MINYRKMLAVFALGTSLFLAGNAHASLIGDAVNVTLTGSIELEDLNVIVTEGIELSGEDNSTDFGSFFFNEEFIDIQAMSIEINLSDALGEFAMLTFSDLNLGADITDAILTSSIDTVTQMNISFTATSVTLDLSEYFALGGQSNLNLALSTVSEVSSPSVFALFSMVLAGLFVSRKKLAK